MDRVKGKDPFPRILLRSGSITLAGLALAFALSIPGHYRLWIFTASLNDNAFVTALLCFVLALVAKLNHTDSGGFYMVLRIRAGSDDAARYSRFAAFFLAGLALILISAFAPALRL
jgi:hypothetical protein